MGKRLGKLSTFGKKHRPKEILIIGLASIAVSAFALYLIILQFGLVVSIGIGDIILAYVPHLMIIAVGGIFIGYPSPKTTWMGVGMLIVGLGLTLIDIGKMVFLA